uniref:Ribonuclease H-like domain-containing protein n=1 Tax=Tanacetum cinerariifolium TaxID=118510 RepID=A0A699HCD0_TANCI|nr:ribonuclease H-like domain-containing protein [Tanacetum cinerariifolium]
MSTVAEYQNEFEMLISRVTGKSENLLKMMYISGLKVAIDRTIEGKAYHFSRSLFLSPMPEARFEDEQTITTIVNLNDFNIAIPDQVLEESILNTSDKVKKLFIDHYSWGYYSHVLLTEVTMGKKIVFRVIMASGGSDRDAKHALSKLLQMGTMAEYESGATYSTVEGKAHHFSTSLLFSPYDRGPFWGRGTTTTIVNPNDLNIAIPDQVLEESILDTSDKVEITSDNDARDQASDVETKVTLSRSSIEAEYRGVANVVAETRWVCNLLREPHAPLCMATLVYFDNVSVVYMSTNPVHHQCTKHIDIDTYFVCDFVASG